MLRTRFVGLVTITDPDTQCPVEIEIRKLETGALVGLDGSFLAQDVGPVFSPYDDGEELEISDDEESTEIQAGDDPAFG